MAEKIGNETKMTAAKNSLKNLVTGLPGYVNISLVVYGHKGSNSQKDKQTSCSAIEEVYPLGPINQSSFNTAVDSFSPTGWTPIGGAFRKAKEILTTGAGQNNLVFLVTDGLETCDTNPESAIKELNSSNIQTVVNIIGFAVSNTDSASLQNLATLGKGQYFLATDSNKLDEIFANFKKSLETLRCNQSNSQTYISCVAKKSDEAQLYLNKLNQSLYQNRQPYQGIQAGTDDSHEDISQTQTKIIEYKNKAGETFSNLLNQNSNFFGEIYKEFQN